MTVDEATHDVTEVLDRLDSRESEDVAMVLLQAVERMSTRLHRRGSHRGSGWRDGVRAELVKRASV